MPGKRPMTTKWFPLQTHAKSELEQRNIPLYKVKLDLFVRACSDASSAFDLDDTDELSFSPPINRPLSYPNSAARKAKDAKKTLADETALLLIGFQERLADRSLQNIVQGRPERLCSMALNELLDAAFPQQSPPPSEGCCWSLHDNREGDSHCNVCRSRPKGGSGGFLRGARYGILLERHRG